MTDARVKFIDLCDIEDRGDWRTCETLGRCGGGGILVVTRHDLLEEVEVHVGSYPYHL